LPTKTPKPQTNGVKVDSTGSLALTAEKTVELQNTFRKDTTKTVNPLGITTYNSAFAQHLHHSPHSFQPSKNIMYILQKFYTYSDTTNNNPHWDLTKSFV
jgi:hypothetical protein